MTRRPAPIDLDALIAKGLVTAINGVPVAAPTAAPVDEDAEEKDFQACVVKEAKANGWLCFHPREMRKSQAGYFDLTLLRERVLFVELKAATKLRADQLIWKEAAERIEAVSGGLVKYRLWKAADWPAIVRELSTTPAAPERG